jgi:hypothetical protein
LHLQEAKGDKDMVPQMKQQCLEDPSGLTKNVKLPAEVRRLCVAPLLAWALTPILRAWIQLRDMCMYLKSACRETQRAQAHFAYRLTFVSVLQRWISRPSLITTA